MIPFTDLLKQPSCDCSDSYKKRKKIKSHKEKRQNEKPLIFTDFSTNTLNLQVFFNNIKSAQRHKNRKKGIYA
jgi:hypothetical protein